MLKINFKLSFLFSLILLLSLASCESDDPMEDEEKPSINLISPTMDDMYMNGDTVYIQAEIADNDELHEISGKITHTHMGVSTEVWSLDTHSHLDTYILKDMYVIDVAGMHNDFTLELEVSDHNGNVGTKEFHFHVM